VPRRRRRKPRMFINHPSRRRGRDFQCAKTDGMLTIFFVLEGPAASSDAYRRDRDSASNRIRISQRKHRVPHNYQGCARVSNVWFPGSIARAPVRHVGSEARCASGPSEMHHCHRTVAPQRWIRISSFDNRTSGLGGRQTTCCRICATSCLSSRRRRVDPPRCLV